MNKDSWCFKYSFAKVCKNKCEAREECMKNAIRKAKEKEILENIKIQKEQKEVNNGTK